MFTLLVKSGRPFYFFFDIFINIVFDYNDYNVFLCNAASNFYGKKINSMPKTKNKSVHLASNYTESLLRLFINNTKGFFLLKFNIIKLINLNKAM